MPSNETLRQEVLGMQARDQEMRKTIMARYGLGVPFSPEDAAWVEAVDGGNTRRMQEIIRDHGWPSLSVVGEDGAAAAWLLVQHADETPDFQKQCLELLEAAVAVGEASARNLAYLTDRVRVHDGLPQVYGTQGQWVDGKLALGDIEEADGVDQRRAAMGLEPVAEYLATLKRHYGDDSP